MLARLVLLATLAMPTVALAEVSPYAGQQNRAIKALSDADIEGLLQGKGMELAKPAELNSYPGPSHVLDLAAELGLTGEQVAAVEAIRGRMSAGARSLGREVIAAERHLDQLFAQGRVDPASLKDAVAAAAEASGRLRTVHLAAHLDIKGILTPEQVRQYDRLRGYGQPAEGPTAAAGHAGH